MEGKMNVNGFQIDTYEGAKSYLENEGLDVEILQKRGLKVVERILRIQKIASGEILLPCPFCGSDAQTTKSDETYSTMCENSDCHLSPEAEGYTELESRLNWNKRK